MKYTDTESEKRALESRKRKPAPKRDFNEMMIQNKRPRKTNTNNSTLDHERIINGSPKAGSKRDFNGMIMLMKSPLRTKNNNSTSENNEKNSANHISDEFLNDSSSSTDYENVSKKSQDQVTSSILKNKSPNVDKENMIETVTVGYSSFVDDLEHPQNDPLVEEVDDLEHSQNDPLVEEDGFSSDSGRSTTPPYNGSDNSFDSTKQQQSPSKVKDDNVQNQSAENQFSKQNGSFLENLQIMMNSIVEKICSRIEKKIDEKFTKLSDNFTEMVDQMKRLDKKLEDEPMTIRKDNEFKVPVPIASPEKLTLFNSKLRNTVFREQMVRLKCFKINCFN